MPITSKNYPFEVRFAASEKMYEWLKSVSSEKDRSVGLYTRDLVAQEMSRTERQKTIRKTDPLIEEIHPLVKLMAEKMGVDLPDSEGENSAEKEG